VSVSRPSQRCSQHPHPERLVLTKASPLGARSRRTQLEESMPRRSSVTATTALAVGAIACALPGALAGSNAPQAFPRDCIKEATLGKCVAGDKIFGDKPDPKFIDAMKDLLSHPLMSGPDDAATLSGLSNFAKKAKKQAAKVKVDKKLKKAAEKAKKVADALKGDSDKKQKETDEVEKAVKTAEDAVEAAKKKLEDAMKKGDAKAIKKAKGALDGLKGKADIQKKKFKGFKEAAQKAAKAAQKAIEDAKKSQDTALAEGEIPGDMYTEGEIPGDMYTPGDSEKLSILKSALQGCDVSTIAQCMTDSNAPEAQAKGKEIKNMISGSKWKSIDVACSYKSLTGKPSCEDLLKNKPKLTIPRRARLGAEQAQGQTGAAYVAVIASVAAFAGYTVYQRRQQDEPLPTYEGYGAM